MTITTNYSMEKFIGRREPEQKYVHALQRIRSLKPGITSEDTMTALIKYMEEDPSDVYMSNKAREAILQRHFLTLALPSIPSSIAVSTLQSCDVHLETLLYTSRGHYGDKFSNLVLGEYSYLLPPRADHKLDDSTEKKFDKSPLHRLLAIKVVFEKHLKTPCAEYAGNSELAKVHAEYSRVKENFSQLLGLHGLEGLSPERSPTPQKSDLDTTKSIAQQAETLRKKSDSPDRGSAIRAFIQHHLDSKSPSQTEESSYKGSPEVVESPEDAIRHLESSPPRIETRISSPAQSTPKPTINVSTRLVATPAPAMAWPADTKRVVSNRGDGKITCTIRK